MKHRVDGWLSMALLLVAMLTLASDIQMVRASGAVYRVGDANVRYVTELEESSFNGYTLFAPLSSTTTYLISNGGEVVHTWASDYLPGLSVYLLENGNLLRACAGARVQKIEWDGPVVWDFECSSDQHDRHHDIEPLPNGNVLMIARECKTAAEAIAAGRDPDMLSEGELQPDHVIEVEPSGATGGNIVWEWHVWDHLIQDYDSGKENYGVVADHPELVDINFPRSGPGSRRADWNHMNSIDYNEEFDQILLSVNTFNEIWVIDHSTTTEEAAGHTGGNSGKGGDILYRWGNPQAYRAGDESDRKFFKQHDAQWIESGCPGEGNILVFNNGNNRPIGEFYSSVDEIVPPVDENGNYSLIPGSPYGPEEQTWVYTAENPTDFFSTNLSGAQRLPNGNTLICSGTNGYFFEVTQQKETVWEYTNPFPGMESNRVFKVHRYAPDFPGLTDLTQPTNDVAITGVTTGRTIVCRGNNCPMNVTVENQGNSTETFNVTAYANTTAIETLSVTNLPTGNSTTIIFTWNTTGFPYGNYTISANANIVPGETDTMDNILTDGWAVVTIPGDVNGDEMVDIVDLATVGRAFGTQPGDLQWSPDADLNQDNLIDIDDLIIAARNYGRTV